MNAAILIAGSLGFGLALGLFGSGGSLLALPALVYGLGFDVKQGVVGSLVVVGITALIGMMPALRRKEICVRNAFAFLAASLPASYGGSAVGRIIDPRWQMLAFAVLVVAASLRLAFWKAPEGKDTCNPRLLPLFWVGGGVGFLTGLLGVGGGFLIVPALVLLGGIGVKMARGTSLLLIAANAATSFAGYAGRIAVPWESLGWVIGLSLPASLAGAAIARRFSAKGLQKAFAWFLLALGIYLVLKTARGFL